MLFVGVLAELGEYAASALRMQEANQEAFSTTTGGLVNQAHFLLRHLIQGIRSIVHAIGM